MKFRRKLIMSVLLQNLPRGNKLHWVMALGADIIMDYTTTDFEQVLHDYDVVFDTQGDKILTKSLNVLKRGGQIIRISGPPDLNFAEAIHANWLLKKVIPLLSWSIRCKAKQRGIDYSFLFMQPNGAQLTQITQLDEAEKLKPIIDQIHDFDQAQEALQYVNTGRSKGKVILKIKS